MALDGFFQIDGMLPLQALTSSPSIFTKTPHFPSGVDVNVKLGVGDNVAVLVRLGVRVEDGVDVRVTGCVRDGVGISDGVSVSRPESWVLSMRKSQLCYKPESGGRPV